MSVRLPMPQQRLALARGLQRVATRVGHHHFAELTEVACGRIEAEMVPKEVSDKPKRSRRKSRNRVDREGGIEGEAEASMSGAIGELPVGDEQGNEGFVFSPEERGAIRDVPPANGQHRVEVAQSQPRTNEGMRRRFGKDDRGSQGHGDQPPRRRSSRYINTYGDKENRETPRNHERHSHHEGPEHHKHHDQHKERKRRHRRKHSHKVSPPPPKKQKLDWKVLLRGFIKGVAEYEMRKRISANQPPPSQRPQQQQSLPPSSKRRRSRTNRPPRSPSLGPSIPRITGSTNNRRLSLDLQSPPQRPQSRSSSPRPSPSRPRQRRKDSQSDDEPTLTPGQIHWREVRAREQGQADMMRAEEEEEAHHPKESLADPISTAPKEPNMPTIAATSPSQPEDSMASLKPRHNAFSDGWSFPSNLSPSPLSNVSTGPMQLQPSPPPKTQPTLQVPTETVRWGDPIKERENRQRLAKK